MTLHMAVAGFRCAVDPTEEEARQLAGVIAFAVTELGFQFVDCHIGEEDSFLAAHEATHG